jgi:predicted DNA-binding protein with PD1-like motif
MQYSEGSLGRIFILRIDDGEDLLESIQKFVKEKCVESGMMLFLGAMKDSRAVTGPEKPVIPPVPHFETFQSAWEVFGMATIYQSKTGPKIHMHCGMGRERVALVGCLRDKASVYLVVEAVLMEFKGLNARKELDEKTGLFLLSLDESL